MLAKELNVESHVTFHGRISNHNQLAKYYSSADVFMLLSENQPNGDVEGFGIVALEANFYGLPVVGAKYCGVEEAVLHKKSGYLVDGNNYNEIYEGVSFCISNNLELKQSMKNWINIHKWSNIILRYTQILN
jgi:phosphatidylinositol alpha-1,6-mannosyltransferase